MQFTHFWVSLFVIFIGIASAVPVPVSPLKERDLVARQWELEARGKYDLVDYSPNEKDWPTVAQLNKILATGKDKAWFWTGKVKDVKGESVILLAKQMAERRGGTTLEMALKKAHAKMPNPMTGGKKGDARWDAAARIFAQRASGVVHVLRGESVRPGNTFDAVEFPALKRNKAVVKVVETHPLSPTRETVIWPAKHK